MPSIQMMKADIGTMIEFYRRFQAMNVARRALAGGGGYPSERRAAFDRAWDALEGLQGEMERISTTYPKEEADVR